MLLCEPSCLWQPLLGATRSAAERQQQSATQSAGAAAGAALSMGIFLKLSCSQHSAEQSARELVVYQQASHC